MLGLLVNRKHLEVYFLGLVIALQLAPDLFVWALVVVAGGIILSLLDRQKKKHRVTSEAVPSTSNQTAPKVNRKIAPPAAPAVRRYTRKQESSFPYPVPRRLPVEVAICEARTKAGRRVYPIASGARRSSSRVASAIAAREGHGLRISVADRQRQSASQFLFVREEASPPGREIGRRTDRRRTTLRASQSSA